MANKTLKQVLKNINREYYLPGIQRTFEWEPEDTELLFDSLLRGLPIGEISLWTLSDDDAQYRSQYYYEFIENHITDGLNPFTIDDLDGDMSDVFSGDEPVETAHPSGDEPKITHVNTPVKGSPDSPTVSLVIDGQQRLTALYIGLFGSIVTYRENSKRKLKKNWDKKYLYINLAGDPNTEDERNCKYEFRFRWADEESEPTGDEYWFRVCDLVHHDETVPYKLTGSVESFVDNHIAEEYGYGSEDEELPTDLRDRLVANLEALRDCVNDSNVLDIESRFHEMNGGDRNRVKRAFFRLNERGSDVTKSQKLLSHAVISWAYDDDAKKRAIENGDAFNPREDIFSLVSRFNSDFSDDEGVSHYNINLKPAFQALSGISRGQVRPDHNLSEDEMQKMKRCWIGIDDDGDDGPEPNKFEDTLWQVFQVLKEELAITENSGLPGMNSVIPLLHFSHHHSEADLRRPQNQRLIRRYLLSVAVSGVTANNADQWVDAALGHLEGRHDEDIEVFPYDDIAEAVEKNGGSKHLQPVREEMVARLDSNITYKNAKRSRFVLSHLRDRFSISTKYEVDHIFPQALFNEENYDEMGLSEEQREAYETLKHSLWNLEILRDSVHNVKTGRYDKQDPGNDTVEKWLDRVDDDEFTDFDASQYKNDHDIPDEHADIPDEHADIPDEHSLYDFKNFLQFIKHRREMMLKKLLKEYDYQMDGVDLNKVNGEKLDELVEN